MSLSADGQDHERRAIYRRYRRLWIAREDLEEARRTIREILRRRLRRLRETSGYHPLLIALNAAVLIAYGRAFANSRGDSSRAEKTLPESVLRVYTALERDLHQYVMEMRHQQVAHSDPEFLELGIEIVCGDADIGIYRVPRQPLWRTDLRRLDKMIEKLLNRIESDCAGLRSRLPSDVSF